jgi:hypothetical protein
MGASSSHSNGNPSTGPTSKSKTCAEPSRCIQDRKWMGFLAILGLLMSDPGMAKAQQAKKVPRIGYLTLTQRTLLARARVSPRIA